MDSIITDLTHHWLSRYNADHGDNKTKADITDWQMHTCIPIKFKIYDYLYEPGFFADLPAIPGALVALESLVKLGHNIIVASAPSWPGTSASDKISWIQKHAPFIHKRNMMLGHHKYLLKGDVFIDDSPTNIEDYRAAWPETPIMTIAHPYNQHIKPLTNVFAEDYAHTEVAWAAILEAITKIP